MAKTKIKDIHNCLSRSYLKRLQEYYEEKHGEEQGRSKSTKFIKAFRYQLMKHKLQHKEKVMISSLHPFPDSVLDDSQKLFLGSSLLPYYASVSSLSEKKEKK